MPNHAVMKHWHPMVGLDRHIQIPNPPAPPIPGMWYATFNPLGGTVGWFTTVRYCPNHSSSGWGYTIARGSDIGPMIFHFGPMPHLTLMLEQLFSYSKCHFGPRGYVMKDNRGGKANVAAALGYFWNPNLNCGYPAPTPTGIVWALNTHFVALTLGDIFAGCAQMVVDTVVARVLFSVGNVVGDKLSERLARMVPDVSRGARRRAAEAIADKLGKKTQEVWKQTGGQPSAFKAWLAKIIPDNAPRVAAGLFNFFGGGPGGLDAGTFDKVGLRSVYSATGGDWLGSRGNYAADFHRLGPGDPIEGPPPDLLLVDGPNGPEDRRKRLPKEEQ